MSEKLKLDEISIRLDETATDKYVFFNEKEETMSNSSTEAGDHIVLLNQIFGNDIETILRPFNILVNIHKPHGSDLILFVDLIYSFRYWNKKIGNYSDESVRLGNIYITDVSTSPLKRHIAKYGRRSVSQNQLRNPEEKEILSFYIIRFVPSDSYQSHIADLDDDHYKEIKTGIRTALQRISNAGESLDELIEETNALEKTIPALTQNVTRGTMARMRRSKKNLHSRRFFREYLEPGPKGPKGYYGNIAEVLERLTPDGKKSYKEWKNKAAEMRRQKIGNFTRKMRPPTLLERMRMKVSKGGSTQKRK